MNSAVAEYFISNMQPVSTVENTAFKKLLAIMDPNYTLPSASDFGKVLGDLVEQQKPIIENDIQTSKHIALSLESFKVNVCESRITISIHLITKEWQMCLKTLRTFDTSENVTSDSENTIHQILRDWAIPDHKIVGIVSESRFGFEGIPSLSEADIQHYTCFDKTLKTAASCAFILPEVSVILTNVRKCITICNNDSTVRAGLQLVCQRNDDLNPEFLVRDDSSHWITTYNMLKVFNKFRLGYSLVSYLLKNRPKGQGAKLQKIILFPFGKPSLKICFRLSKSLIFAESPVGNPCQNIDFPTVLVGLLEHVYF